MFLNCAGGIFRLPGACLRPLPALGFHPLESAVRPDGAFAPYLSGRRSKTARLPYE